MDITHLFLDKSRAVGDSEADELIASLFQNGKQSELHAALQLTTEQLASRKATDAVTTFLHAERKQPDWFDAERIQKGQRVFEFYAAEIMMLLGALALPFCYAGSPGNKALHRSDKMRQSPGKRLLDTAQFIISVCTPGSFDGNMAMISINKTRLIHAMARYYVQKKEWDSAWGLPINQEDMAGTNLAFSSLILVGLQQTGFTLTDRQKEDYIYLWRYIGYQLAVEEELLPTTFREAFGLTQIIKHRNFKSSIEGMELTKELLAYYQTVAPPDQSWLMEAQIRYFLGQEVSDLLGLRSEFVKDKIATFFSTTKEFQNFFSAHKSSYQTMLNNHQLLQKSVQKNRPVL